MVSIKSRLYLSSAAALILTAAVAITAYVGLERFSSAVEDLANDDIAVFQVLSELRDANLLHRIYLREALVAAEIEVTGATMPFGKKESREPAMATERRMEQSIAQLEAMRPRLDNHDNALIDKLAAGVKQMLDESRRLDDRVMARSGYMDAARQVAQTRDALVLPVLNEYIAHKADETKEAVESTQSLHKTVVRVIGAATLVAIVVLLASAYIISRSIIAALAGAQGMARTLATGNFLGFENCRNDCSYGKAVNCRREQCEVGQLNISLETMRSSLSTAIGSVQKKAGEAADLAGVLASGTQQAAAATEHQAEQIQQVSAAIEQLDVSISQIASAGREVQDNSSESTRRAEAGVQATTDMCSNMGDIVAKAKETAMAVSSLRASAKGIEQFTQTIKEIADQTNLLALNAAIEAARAGEQGRGFAVVADEVRKLAERTGTTTQSIDQLARQISQDISGTVTSIEAIERTAVHGMGVAESSAETLKHIMDATAQVQQMITEITSASSEQKSAADLSAQSMERIAAAAEENSAVIENVKASAAEINAIADHLNDLSGRFKVATS